MRRWDRAAFWTWVLIFSALVVISLLVAFRAIDRLDHQRDIDLAQDCTQDWRRYEGARETVDKSMVGSGEAIIEAATLANQVPNPALLDRYRDIVALHVVSAQEALEAPRCDRKAAQRQLEG